MGFLHWYDWITPTNPYASLLFGFIFTFILGFFVWFDTRQKRTTAVAFLTGTVITIVGVSILNAIGFYH